MAIFRPLHPRNSLRKLRTAFSPSTRSGSPTSASLRSPLSTCTSASSSHSSGYSFDSMDSLSSRPSSHRRVIRAHRSVQEMQQEEERSVFGDRVVAIVEPRPLTGPSRGGIEEVLEGRI